MAEVQDLKAHAAAALNGSSQKDGTTHSGSRIAQWFGALGTQTGSKAHAVALPLRRVRSNEPSHSTKEDNGRLRSAKGRHHDGGPAWICGPCRISAGAIPSIGASSSNKQLAASSVTIHCAGADATGRACAPLAAADALVPSNSSSPQREDDGVRDGGRGRGRGRGRNGGRLGGVGRGRGGSATGDAAGGAAGDAVGDASGESAGDEAAALPSGPLCVPTSVLPFALLAVLRGAVASRDLAPHPPQCLC